MLTTNAVKIPNGSPAAQPDVIAHARSVRQASHGAGHATPSHGGSCRKILPKIPLIEESSQLTTQLRHELRRRGGGYGMVMMCIGSGMGAAGIFEVYPA